MTRRILILAPYPFDSAPSQRFRFEQYLGFLNAANFRVQFSPFLGERAWKTLYQPGKVFKKSVYLSFSFFRRFLLMFTIWRYDYVFIHREASMIGPPIFEWIIAKIWRKQYIYDFDDAIWLPNYSDTNARFQKFKMYSKIAKIIKWAGTVNAGNQFLKDYANQFNANVNILPTTIDTINVHSKVGNPLTTNLVIGWTGTHTTMQYLEPLLPILDRLAKQHNFVFRVISNQAPNFNRNYLDFVKWRQSSEIDDLATFNIGIMPLTDSDWAKGKCGFKGLQYMALGIPGVMSPVGANIDIVDHNENGFLCADSEEWFETLSSLLTNEDLRKKIGNAGRKTVQEKYSVIANKTAFLNLFEA